MTGKPILASPRARLYRSAKASDPLLVLKLFLCPKAYQGRGDPQCVFFLSLKIIRKYNLMAVGRNHDSGLTKLFGQPVLFASRKGDTLAVVHAPTATFPS